MLKHTIRINNNIILTSSLIDDKKALVNLLNDTEIQNQTLRIPFPYTEADAIANINYNLSFQKKNNKQRNWVIRNDHGDLMGHIGLHYPYGLDSNNNEVYYWLGKPFRNKGIMSLVLNAFTNYCFTNLNIHRLEAPIFEFNTASEKTLIKCGYTLEKQLPNHYKKGEQIISAKLYVKEKP